MNPLPPAFVREGVPYVPSEEDRKNCRWARIALAKECSESPDCASCPYHPQNRSRMWEGKKP